ncbi:MAG: hypothetical protein H6564_23585 [Lewinellaceae bacterium]|nr:hypothetical protein [Lewinellaceae bacterium]
MDYIMDKTNRIRLARLLLLLLIAGMAFVPIDIPYTIGSMAKILPAREWVLSSGQDGYLSIALHDHVSGKLKLSEGFQSERGDFVRVEFSDTVQYISKGDAVATIVSSKLDEQLNSLRAQLAVEMSNHDVVATGEKEQLLGQLQEEINLYREGFILQKKNYERSKKLLEEGIIAVAEMERAENAYNEAARKVEVAEKALRVAATGQKKESVFLVSTRIASLKKQIAFLEEKQKLFSITAPFDGLVRIESTATGDRLIIEDTTASVLAIPVRRKDSRFVYPGQHIQVKLEGSSAIIDCSVLSVGAEVEFLDRDEVVALKALTKAKNLPSGMPVRCEARCDSVRVPEFLSRSIRWQ